MWFIHFRGEGDAIKLAQAVHNVLKATSTPLPQTMPSNPSTPLDVGCLYNQETGEDPQLYFSHTLKTGDAYALAKEVRRGLDKTDSD